MTLSAEAAMREIHLAKAATAARDYYPAIVALRKVVDAGPRIGAAWAEVASLASNAQDDDLAAAAARRLCAETPDSRDFAMAHARALNAAGRADEAVAVLSPWEKRGELTPNDRFLLARVLQFSNRLGEAEKVLRELIALYPENPFGWETLALGKTFVAGDPDIDAMRALKGRIDSRSHKEWAAIHYALGKAYVDLGDDAAAAEVLQTAANARLAVARYDERSLDEAERGALELFEDEPDLGSARDDTLGRGIIFVLGPPRSGTSLVEQILSRHSEVAAGGEVKYLWLASRGVGALSKSAAHAFVQRERARGRDDPWGAMGRRYLEFVERRSSGKSRFSDKLLTNHLRLGLIRRALPAAKVVWCRRDLLDVAWSCWRANFSAEMSWSNDPRLIAKFLKSYRRVMGQWSERHPVVVVDYDRLASAPDEEIPRLLAGLQLSDEAATRSSHAADRPVTTMSFSQVRAPITAARVGAARAFPRSTSALQAALDAAVD